MTAYTVEPIVSKSVVDLLITEWDDHEGNVPLPIIIDINDQVDPSRMANLEQEDSLAIYANGPSLKEDPIGNWEYGHRYYSVHVELVTRSGRQRLYDLQREVRRICHANMHLMVDFQRIQFLSFEEDIDEAFQINLGTIEIELVNSAVYLER